jgi:hypothetical protein
MKAILLMFIFLLPLSGFAKTNKTKYTKDSFKFDERVYYKLKFPDRVKYLKVFIDFAKEIDAPKKVSSHFDIYRLIFPTADAVYGKDWCLTGGIYYAPPCEKLPATSFSDDIKPAFSNCKNNNRCAAYFGVDSGGNGFCFTNEKSATTQCASQSSPKAIQDLNQLLANPTDAKAAAMKAALLKDLDSNDFIKKACLDNKTKKGSCEKLASAIATYKGKAEAPNGPLGSDTTGKGCNDAEAQAVNAAAGKSGKVNQHWYLMLKTAALACGTTYSAMTQKMGVCETEEPGVNVESDLRSGRYDQMRKALASLENKQSVTPMSDPWKQFTNYMGVTPDEMKKVFCAKSSGLAFKEAVGNDGVGGLTLSAPGGNSEGFKDRRERFKSCVKSTIKKQTVNDRDDGSVDKYLSNRSHSACQFKKASARIEDIIANPSKYQSGKYYFSDNVAGNCYGLSKAASSCSGFSFNEKRDAEVNNACTRGNEEEPAKAGISANANGYLMLSPIHQDGTSKKIVDVKDISSGYAFYEYDCGSSFKHCVQDNDYCGEGAPPKVNK